MSFKTNSCQIQINNLKQKYFSLVFAAIISIISTQTFAINVNCDFSDSKLETYGPLKNVYQCKSKSLSVSGHQKVEKVNGVHQGIKKNDDVKLINIKQIKSERMPSEFDKHFKNLEGIFASSMGLKTLVKDDLSSYPKLRYVDFGFNKIVTLPSNLFENNPDIEWIDFSDNYLQNIGVNLLNPLTKLNYADFQSNRCVDFRAWDKTNLKELQFALKAVKCALNDA